MSTVDISILVNTYNQERFIEECLASALAQDFDGNYEVVVVDDGTTDTAPTLIQQLAAQDEHIRYVRKENGGQASAINRGIEEAKGEVLCFLDGDDRYRPEKLRTIWQYFRARPKVEVIGNGIHQFSTKEATDICVSEPTYVHTIDASSAKAFTRIRPLFGTSRISMRAETARRLFPIPEELRFEADEFLFTQAALRTGVLAIPEILTDYRLHDNNLYMLSGFKEEKIRFKYDILGKVAQINTRLIEEFQSTEAAEIEPIINEMNYKGLANLGILLGVTDQVEAQRFLFGKRYWLRKLLGPSLMLSLQNWYASIRRMISPPAKTIWLK